MTYDAFWNGDVELVKFYREAFRLKQQMRNEELWLQGVYFRDAIAACFSDKKNKFSYPKEPYDFAEKRKTKRKNETKERKSDDKAKAVMEMFMVNFNRKFEQKGGEENGGKCGNAGH